MLQGIPPEAFEKVADTEIKYIIGRCISTTATERYMQNAIKKLLSLLKILHILLWHHHQ